ncbi:MAG: amidohydrolase [Deltaproteobacteria bacterium]|nr:amidohydrolase [Deltaproteobacteria bacterium]
MSEKWLVIDMHNHFYPKKTAEMVKNVAGMNMADKMKARPGFYAKTHDLEKRVQLMDEAGVDMTVLNQAAWSPQGIEMCRAINDGYAEAGRQWPDRYIPCAHVPPEGGPDALDELDRAINDLGLKGLSLVTSSTTATLDSEALFPVYERVSQYDIPIVVHPTVRPGIWDGDKYGMADHVAREYDVARAVVEVMYGVLNRFPDLKFILPHHGGGIPALKGRIKSHFEPEGWDIPEDIKGFPKTPRELTELGLDDAFEELFGKLYFDTAGFGGWMPITEAAVNTIRSDRICFGTDYPFEIHESQDVKIFIEKIKAMDISEQDRRNILGENVKGLFKI